MTSSKLKAAQRRAAVVAAVQSGQSPRLVAVEFNVSLASVYNWINAVKAGGPGALLKGEVDRRWRFGLQSPDQVERFVKIAVQQFPDITPDDLSRRLEVFGYDAPSRTLREVFRRVGLGTKAQRNAVAQPVDALRINDEELERVIHEIEAETKDYIWPTSVCLLQDYVKLPSKLGHPGAIVQILVADSYPKLGLTALAGVDKELLAAEALAAAVCFYKHHGVDVVRVTVPRGYVFDPVAGSRRFVSQAARFEIEVAFDNEVTQRHDLRIRSAKDTLWRKWLHVRMPRFIQTGMSIQDINSNLIQWVSEHDWGIPNPVNQHL